MMHSDTTMAGLQQLVSRSSRRPETHQLFFLLMCFKGFKSCFCLQGIVGVRFKRLVTLWQVIEK
jgi:hypothetical protein